MLALACGSLLVLLVGSCLWLGVGVVGSCLWLVVGVACWLLLVTSQWGLLSLLVVPNLIEKSVDYVLRFLMSLPKPFL